jgi:hypothetical protein
MDSIRCVLIFLDHVSISSCILTDWTYCFYPNLTVYRMPYPELVLHLRTALQKVKSTADSMEKSWTISRPSKPQKSIRTIPKSLDAKSVPQLFFPGPKSADAQVAASSQRLIEEKQARSSEVTLSPKAPVPFVTSPSKLPPTTTGDIQSSDDFHSIRERRPKTYQLFQQKPLLRPPHGPDKRRGQ